MKRLYDRWRIRRASAEGVLIPPSVFESQQGFPRFVNVAKELGLVTSTWHTSRQLRYFRNNGTGKFTERTADAGFQAIFGGLNLVHADYDNDGDLDLFVGNEGFPCRLFGNERGASFLDVAKHAGATNSGVVKGSCLGDYNGLRYPELYISNLDGPNKLYRNNRNGRFTDVAKEAGVVARTLVFRAGSGASTTTAHLICSSPHIGLIWSSSSKTICVCVQ